MFYQILAGPPIKLKRSKTFATGDKPCTYNKEDIAPTFDEEQLETYVRNL